MAPDPGRRRPLHLGTPRRTLRRPHIHLNDPGTAPRRCHKDRRRDPRPAPCPGLQFRRSCPTLRLTHRYLTALLPTTVRGSTAASKNHVLILPCPLRHLRRPTTNGSPPIDSAGPLMGKI